MNIGRKKRRGGIGWLREGGIDEEGEGRREEYSIRYNMYDNSVCIRYSIIYHLMSITIHQLKTEHHTPQPSNAQTRTPQHN